MSYRDERGGRDYRDDDRRRDSSRDRKRDDSRDGGRRGRDDRYYLKYYSCTKIMDVQSTHPTIFNQLLKQYLYPLIHIKILINHNNILGENVTLSNDGSKVTVSADVAFSKR